MFCFVYLQKYSKPYPYGEVTLKHKINYTVSYDKNNCFQLIMNKILYLIGEIFHLVISHTNVFLMNNFIFECNM
jgi:hypothetical protein